MLYLLLSYGAFILGGGIVGYLKTGSIISLISGAVSGLSLLNSARGIYQKKHWAIPSAIGIAALLAVFFGLRFFTTLKFIPSGLFSLSSLGMAISLYFRLKRLHLIK